MGAIAVYQIGQKKIRLAPYVSAILGWLIFVPWLGVLRIQMMKSGGGRSSWIAPTRLTDLKLIYNDIRIFPESVLILILLWVLLDQLSKYITVESKPYLNLPESRPGEGFILLLACALLAMPVLLWAHPTTGLIYLLRDIFSRREIGWAFLLAHAVDRLYHRAKSLIPRLGRKTATTRSSYPPGNYGDPGRRCACNIPHRGALAAWPSDHSAA